MAFSQNIPFGTPGNYVYDTDKIEVSGGQAGLKLIDSPGQVFAEDFADDTGFTYDSDLAEFTGGVLRQKDQTPSNSIMSATYTSTIDLSWRNDGGSLSGVVNGAPTISGGKLVCFGAHGVRYVRDTVTQESWKIKYTPNYSGSPSTNINIFGSSGTTQDRCAISHSPSGDNIRLFLYDNSSVLIYSATTIGASGISLVAGTEYEIELVIDSTAGTVRLFIDGNLHGALAPGAWARGGITKDYYVGADQAVYNVADASFSDYIVFDNIQHSASYTAGYSLPETKYAENKVDGPNFTYTGVGSIQSVDNGSTTEVGSPRYIIAGQYWDGAAWVASDGSYAQANSFATALSNFTEFAASGGIVPWSVVFGDSNTLSSVDEFSVEVTGQIYSTDNPSIEPTLTFFADKIISVTTTTDPADLTIIDDEIKFIFRAANKWYYVDAGVIAETDGDSYAEASTVDEWNAALGDWNPDGGFVAKTKLFLHSDNGQTEPSILEMNISYDFNGEPADAIEECIVWGYSKTIEGEVDTDPITVKLKQQNVQYKDFTNIDSSTVTVTPRSSDGYWELSLADNVNMLPANASYIFNVGGIEYDRVVPNSTSEDFWDLVAPA